MTFKEKYQSIIDYEIKHNVADEERIDFDCAEIDVDIRYIELFEISESRQEDLLYWWNNETNDEETENWRSEDLNEIEKKYLDLLDEKFSRGTFRLYSELNDLISRRKSAEH